MVWLVLEATTDMFEGIGDTFGGISNVFGGPGVIFRGIKVENADIVFICVSERFGPAGESLTRTEK